MNIKHILKIVGLIIVLGMVVWMVGCGGREKISKTPEEEFIEERHELLDETVEKTPEKIINGQILFTTYINNKEFLHIVREYDIKIIKLYHGSDFHNGGYVPEVEIDDPRQILADLLNAQKKSVNELISSAPVKDLNNPTYFGLQKRKKNLDLGLTYFYGLEGETKAILLKNLKDSNKYYVRLVNPILNSDLRILILPPK